MQADAASDIDVTGRQLTWYPDSPVAPDFPDVPEAISDAAREAHSAKSVGIKMAAILMARTVVEASAKEFNVIEGNLIAKINKLKENGLIRASIAEAAHAIRILGNDMAHGDIGETPKAEDVDDVLALMDDVLRELFQQPAKTKRLMERRPPAQKGSRPGA